MELVCPAGNLPSLKAAVDNGADAVYVGFRDATNARHFAGLNFTARTVEQAVAYAQARGRKIYVAINTFPQPAGFERWAEAVDEAARLGVDALILADIGIMDYAHARWPDLRLHVSVQSSVTNADGIRFYHENFGIRRVVLPRGLLTRRVRALGGNARGHGRAPERRPDRPVRPWRKGRLPDALQGPFPRG